MTIKLKQYRANADLTQSALSKLIGVSQPTYQRWESGSTPIPDDKLTKIAKILNTTRDTLLGRHPAISVHLYDDSAGDDLNYYGEMAVHFHGGGAPLLLSITEKTYGEAFRDLQGSAKFVTVRSLSNQTVAIRKKAISDLYLCSEAYDEFGPEHNSYNYIDLHLPDNRDWEIIEALEYDFDPSEFAPSDIDRVRGAIMITDEQYQILLAEKLIPIDQLSAEKNKNDARTQLAFDLASRISYQLSDGKIRRLSMYDANEIYNALCELVDFENDEIIDDMLIIPAEGRHQTAFINYSVLDYISIPTQKYEAGRIEAASEYMEDTI